MIKRSPKHGSRSKKVKRPYVEMGRLIRNLRLRKGLSQSGLARIVDLHPSYISRMEDGERRASPEVLKKMSEALEFPLEDLLVACGLIDDSSAEETAALEKRTGLRREIGLLSRRVARLLREGQGGKAGDIQRSEFIAVPVFDTVPAGIAPSAKQDDTAPLPTLDLPESDLGGDSEAFALVATGDSMIDAGILDGDTVVVSPKAKVNSGDLVVVALGAHDISLKTIYFEGRKALLQAANRNYRPVLLSYPSEVEILGKVILVRRKVG